MVIALPQSGLLPGQHECPGESLKGKNVRLGVVAHTCNPRTWRLRQGDLKFEASLGYMESSRLAM
jgi:hypothetical protein